MAKGLSLARHIPLIGIPTLDILAAAIPVYDIPLAAVLQEQAIADAGVLDVDEVEERRDRHPFLGLDAIDDEHPVFVELVQRQQ